MKGDIQYSFSKNEAISGPRECENQPTVKPPDGPCCATIRLDSTGSLADSGQNHVMGDYVFVSEGTMGRWNYEQAKNNQFGEKRKLYFMPTLGVNKFFHS